MSNVSPVAAAAVAAALDAGPLDWAAIATDASGTIVAVSQGAAAVTGFAADELIGLDAAAVLGAQPPAPGDHDGAWVHKNGSRLPTRLTVSAIPAEGEALAYILAARDRTGTAHAPDTAGEAEVRFQALFEASPVATMITDTSDGRIVMANGACREVLGRDPAELVGRTSIEAGLWTEPERRAALMAEFAREGRIRNFAEEIRTPDGHVKQILLSADPVECRERRCILVTCCDVTEREELGRALRRTEEQLRGFLEHAPILAVVKDLDGCYLFANSSFEQRLVPGGGSPLGLTARDLFEPAVARASEDVERRVIATGEAIPLEQTVPDPGGEPRTYATVRFPLVRDDGEPYGVGIVGTDITESKDAAAALERARVTAVTERARLDAVLAASEDFLIMASDHDGRLTIFNSGAERLTGYAANEVLGRPATTLIEMLGDPGELASFLEATGEKMSFGAFSGPPREWTLTRKDGSRVAIEAAVSPILDRAGAPNGFVSIARDLTAVKDREAELLHARVRAEAGDRAKSEFVSRMSHELRTPLTAILGFGELLAADELDDDQRELVLRITAAGGHLLALVNDLLDLSRGEEQGAPARLEPVPFAESVVEALAMMEPLAKEHRVALLSPELPDAERIWGDPRRLRQVLLNLLSNAVKYNREGGRVTVELTEAGDDRMRLSITDTGPGIAASDQARLFRPFERLGGVTDAVEGTGLGLALSKLLVEQMGGRIGVHSDPGVGSTFWVELARAPADADIASPAEQGGSAREVPAGGAPLSVLYIEDSDSNQYLAERILGEHDGVELRIAATGSEGLARAAAAPPALVLLDLHLPDMSGEEVLRRLRADPDTAAAWIVVVSADATAAQRERLRALGADDYLTKPYSTDELWRVVGEARRGPRPAEEQRAPGGGSIDRWKVAALCGLDAVGDPRGTLARRTLAEATANVDELVRAASAVDAGRVLAGAHRLRTSAAMLGARDLAALASACEAGARGGRMPPACDVEQIRVELDAVEQAVDRLVPVLGGR